MAGGAMMSSCSCGDQTGAAGAGLGADQVEQMISDKLAALMAVNTESVDGKLATLHADLRSWTQQLVMAELANKQQATDAQLLAVADRSADNKKYAEFVRLSSFMIISRMYNSVLSLDNHCMSVIQPLRGCQRLFFTL